MMKTPLLLLSGALGLTGVFPSLAQPTAGAPPMLATPAVVRSATANGDTVVAAQSEDGRFAVLASHATDLTAAPNRGNSVQLYLHDNLTDRLQLVTATPSGEAANGDSGRPSVSADGRWVVFESVATDLVPDDTNHLKDIFLRNVQTGVTICVSRAADGSPASGGFSEDPVLSPDARWIAFTSYATNLSGQVTDTNRTKDVFLYDRGSGQLRVVSKQHSANATGAAASANPLFSPDGRWLAFRSSDGKLAAGDAGDSTTKIFLRSITAETNLWASQGAAAFEALAPPTSNRNAGNALFRADGRHLAYTYGPLVLRFDTASGETVLVGTNYVSAVVTGAGSGGVALSADGRICAREGAPHDGDALPKVPDSVYVWDALSQTIARLHPPLANPSLLGEVGGPVVSADGRKIAFTAYVKTPGEEGFAPGRHWFVHDRGSGQTTRVPLPNVASDERSLETWSPHWSADLGTLAFATRTPNLTPGDWNRALDAFVLDVGTGRLTLLSPVADGMPGITPSGSSFARGQCFSANGRYLVFTSSAPNVAPNDHNDAEDVFLRDLQTGSITLVSVNYTGAGSGNGASHSPVISAEGRYVAFVSLPSDLVEGDTNGWSDVFVRDLATGVTRLVSRAYGGIGSANGASDSPVISADGSRIAFVSHATDQGAPEVAAADVNQREADVFVFDRQTGTVQPVSIRTDGSQMGGQRSIAPVISPDGRYILFQSRANNLVSPAPPLPPTRPTSCSCWI